MHAKKMVSSMTSTAPRNAEIDKESFPLILSFPHSLFSSSDTLFLILHK